MRDIIAGKRENENDLKFFIEAFIHEDGHFGISVCVNRKIDVYHFMIQDMSRYNELVACLKHEFKDIDIKLTIDEIEDNIEGIVDDVVDEYFDEYLEEYPDFEEPEMRTEEEINEYEAEACNRVWLVRKQNMFVNIANGTEIIDEHILKRYKQSINDTCEKYNIDFNEPVSDWYYGYWSGILAALRWVMGEEKDCLDT